VNNIYKKCFCNDEGKLTIAQFPNLPILLALFFIACGFIPGLNSDFKTIVSYLASSFLFVWAYLEIAQGINYFRRALGTIVMIILIFGLIK
jgi:hypothetical protein